MGAIRHDKPDSDWQGDRQGHVPRRRHQKNSWAWLHTKNTSTAKRGKNGSLLFSADDVRAGDYLDVVAMFDVSKSQVWNAR
ncbi:MAG: DUF2207 domain-containing protein [Bifidobacterium adolescentis]